MVRKRRRRKPWTGSVLICADEPGHTDWDTLAELEFGSRPAARRMLDAMRSCRTQGLTLRMIGPHGKVEDLVTTGGTPGKEFV